MKINKILRLRDEDSGIHNLLARVHGCHIKSEYRRRDPVVITNLDNGEKIIRYVLGSGATPGLTKDAIAIDYDGIDTLGFRLHKEIPCELSVRKAGLLDRYRFFAKHPDLGIRLSVQLGLTGAFLGLIGLILGVTSLVT